jgi:transcriptional regulator with XRE-family HTH domain
MPESFGTRLRQQRERQQIALRSIAEQTRISIGLLEGLERDDVKHWPGGIFRRAFVRAYAEHIGLDSVIVVREFQELFPDPAEIVPAVQTGAAEVESPTDAPLSTKVRHLFRSAFDTFSLRRPHAAELVAIAEAASPPSTPTPAVLAPVEPDLTAAADTPTTPTSALLAPAEPDLTAAADLCTELGRVAEPRQAVTVLQQVARMLDAVGVIIWIWDRQSTELRPWLAHGYSDQALARLPRVRRDAKNATAAAFRSMETCVVAGTDLLSGAVVIPLMTSLGCVGVLAVELANGREQTGSVRALATIFAAQLAMLVGTMPGSAEDATA